MREFFETICSVFTGSIVWVEQHSDKDWNSISRRSIREATGNPRANLWVVATYEAAQRTQRFVFTNATGHDVRLGLRVILAGASQSQHRCTIVGISYFAERLYCRLAPVGTRRRSHHLPQFSPRTGCGKVLQTDNGCIIEERIVCNRDQVWFCPSGRILCNCFGSEALRFQISAFEVVEKLRICRFQLARFRNAEIDIELRSDMKIDPEILRIVEIQWVCVLKGYVAIRTHMIASWGIQIEISIKKNPLTVHTFGWDFF